MKERRVVVTGLGLITPVGNSVEEAWSAILAGQSGSATITSFDVSQLATRFSASVKNFDATEYFPRKDI